MTMTPTSSRRWLSLPRGISRSQERRRPVSAAAGEETDRVTYMAAWQSNPKVGLWRATLSEKQRPSVNG
jgi:hypothetical protein